MWLEDGRELGAYLATASDWPGVQLGGRIRRSRRHLGEEAWASQKSHWWVSSLSPAPHRAEHVAQLLRDHWTIENGVFRVRDVSYDEDRLHGCQIGYGLSMVRNVAITLIRGAGYLYIPDGWRDIVCRPDQGLSFLSEELIL